MNKVKIRHLIAAFVCLVLSLAFSSLGSARAAENSTSMSAADLAAACSSRPTFTIDTDKVVSGNATVDTPYGTCWVHLAPGVSLTFEHVTLDSQSSSMGLVVDGDDAAQVHVHQSTMILGGLYLEPGGHEPGHP